MGTANTCVGSYFSERVKLLAMWHRHCILRSKRNRARMTFMVVDICQVRFPLWVGVAYMSSAPLTRSRKPPSNTCTKSDS
jgi:hypothetical protein